MNGHTRNPCLLSVALFPGVSLVTPVCGAESAPRCPPALPWNIVKDPALPGVEHHSFTRKVVGQRSHRGRRPSTRKRSLRPATMCFPCSARTRRVPGRTSATGDGCRAETVDGSPLTRIFHKSFVLGGPFAPPRRSRSKRSSPYCSNTIAVLFDLRPCGGPKFLAQNSQ